MKQIGIVKRLLPILCLAVAVLFAMSVSSEAKLAFHDAPSNCSGGICQRTPDDVFVMNDDGTSVLNLTNDPATTADDNYWDNWPGISADGLRVAFWSSRAGNYDLYIVNTDGTELRRLTNENFMWSPNNSRPVWSPDGTRIIFTQYDGSNVPHVYRVSVNTPIVEVLLTPPANTKYNTWSMHPGGDRVLIDVTGDTNELDIAEYTLSTGTLKYLTGVLDRAGDYIGPDGVDQFHGDYAYDGGRLIFVAETGLSTYDVFINYSNGNPIWPAASKITNDPNAENSPVWVGLTSSDGVVAFSKKAVTKTETPVTIKMMIDGSNASTIHGYVPSLDWGPGKVVGGNNPPVANAGTDQAVHLGTVADLDGSKSSDPDGNYPLTYSWSFVSAPGKLPILNNPTTVSPSFTPYYLGDYTLSLTVTDSLGAMSASDTVTVSTYNTAPVADAGPDQAITLLNTVVQLDGTQSYDVDGDPKSYYWSFDILPAGSAASLSDPFSATPTFVADVKGSYTLSLRVSDQFKASSYDSVVVSYENVVPVAVAGANQAITLGDVVVVDGAGSTDANNDPLTYTWSLVSKPAASTITGLTTLSPTMAEFTPDEAGTYVVSLVVNDGTVDSLPSNVTITVTTVQDAAINTLQDAVGTINTLDPNMFMNRNLGNALTNKISAIITMVNDAILVADQGLYQDAIDKLQNDVLKKTDGCALTGAPDNNDWVDSCAGQELVYPLIIEAIDLISSLL